MALRLAASVGAGKDLVDTKGVGQPFKFSGKSDQDFSAWQFKFKTFVKAKFGNDVETMLNWAGRQRTTVVKEVKTGDAKSVGWSEVFGPLVDAVEQISPLEMPSEW